MLLLIPPFWIFLQPYQRQRVTGFFNPEQDPLGAGYNSIQSMIAVGSGELFGRGLGEGVQTQLKFLPEKHTDFIFAATAEEMGFAGAILIIIGLFVLLWRITIIVENSSSAVARAFASGVFLTLLGETVIHIGMNMGLFPITGIPLPLVSAGGSSLIGTMMSLGMVVSSKKK
jgi:rod shape determining protein RodA